MIILMQLRPRRGEKLCVVFGAQRRLPQHDVCGSQYGIPHATSQLGEDTLRNTIAVPGKWFGFFKLRSMC
jgi:hypothetical protein